VTDLTRTREELAEAHEELEGRVASRTQELAQSNEALRNEMAERATVEDARMQLLSQLVSAQEDERRRFALDLHDQLGQQITALRIKLETLVTQVRDQPQLSNSSQELL
jgi:glucose-6-phosphate-specific signal transduction histidine kinase